MKTKLIMLMILSIALMAGIANAREVATATRIDPSEISGGLATPPGTMVGNLNPIAWGLSGWFFGEESYAVIFNPSEQLGCDAGFQLTTVHMIMSFAPEDVPVTFEVFGDLGSAVVDPTGCAFPGEENCIGEPFTVTIDVEGTYDISVPIECECAYLYDNAGAANLYYLSMHFPTPFTASVVTDGINAACTSYNDYGAGYEDLNPAFGDYGNIVMFADAVCCDQPVSTEDESWGGVKSLFR
jgi:hypothetical protein